MYIYGTASVKNFMSHACATPEYIRLTGLTCHEFFLEIYIVLPSAEAIDFSVEVWNKKYGPARSSVEAATRTGLQSVCIHHDHVAVLLPDQAVASRANGNGKYGLKCALYPNHPTCASKSSGVYFGPIPRADNCTCECCKLTLANLV